MVSNRPDVAPAVLGIAEQRLALAIEAAQLGCWTWDRATGTTTWDERLEEMHGLAPGGFGGTFEDWVEALHPDDRAECIARVEYALAHPGPYVLFHRATWADGSVHSIECRGTVLVDDSGLPIGTTGVAIDVTARQLREAAVGEALAQQRHLVQTLQESLLPSVLPGVPGISVAARHRAAETETEIGGDWYAVVALPGGKLGVAIGDVAGHGLDAVADMAAVRFSLRALALTEPEPDVVLDRLNRVVKVFEGGAMITALYGVLDPHALTWSYASAGHPPVLVRAPDGTTRLLDDGCDPPLGYADAFRIRHAPVPAGATLVLYTDGLVERRGESIDVGLDRLRQVCSAAPAAADALCDFLLDAMEDTTPNRDDVALVAMTLD